MIKIAGLRGDVQSTAGAPLEHLIQRINFLAQEVARLNTGQLNLKLNQTVQFIQGSSKGDSTERSHRTRVGLLRWTYAAQKKWISYKDNSKLALATKSPYFKVGYCSRVKVAGAHSCLGADITTGDSGNPISDIPEAVNCPDGSDCSATLVLREPVASQLKLISTEADLGGSPGRSLGAAELLVSQWGSLSYLPLQVGFGQKKSVTASLGLFGERTSMMWGHNASGEGIVSSLNSISDAQTAYRTKDDASEPDSPVFIANELARLKTRKAYNELKQCQEIIDSGGYVCPNVTE